MTELLVVIYEIDLVIHENDECKAHAARRIYSNIHHACTAIAEKVRIERKSTRPARIWLQSLWAVMVCWLQTVMTRGFLAPQYWYWMIAILTRGLPLLKHRRLGKENTFLH